jgi:hypothetical protein
MHKYLLSKGGMNGVLDGFGLIIQRTALKLPVWVQSFAEAKPKRRTVV